VFLNCSLTEAFCIAILEAACCGLVVVSTDVGGIREVLDADMIRFPDPAAPNVVAGLVDAIGDALAVRVDAADFHARLAARYNWDNVARETVAQVYDRVVQTPPTRLLDVLERGRGLGPLAGLLAVWVVALDAILARVLEVLRPAKLILESAPPEVADYT